MDNKKERILSTEKNTVISTVRRKNGDFVLCFKPRTEINVKKDKTIHLNYKGFDIVAEQALFTIFEKNIFAPLENVCLIGSAPIENHKFLLKAVVSKTFYEMFSSFDEDEKGDSLFNAMNTYLKLSSETQEEIMKQSKGKKYPVIKSGGMRSTDMSALKFKFDFCRATYTPQQQADIESILNDCKNGTSTDKNRAQRRLAYVLEINQNNTENIEFTKSDIVEKLKQKLDGLENVIEKIAEAIVASKYSGVKGFNLLLVGSPGVGKTAIIKAVAEILNRPLSHIPLGSLTDIVDVCGDAPHFEASDCGMVIKAFYRHRTTSMVIGLDEYDKPSIDKKSGYNIGQAFNDALSDEHSFYDAFIGCSINTENTVFIATANSTEDIPEHLLNRFTVIKIPDYSASEKVHIARFYILPELMKQYHIENNELFIDDDTILYIAENYCEDEGVRDLKKHLKTIIDKVLTIWDTNGQRNDFIADIEFVNNTIESYVDTTSPAIIFRRNKDLYSEEVADEIKHLIVKLKRSNLDTATREKLEKKLDYLVNIIPAVSSDNFDADTFFEQVNKTHYGLERVKEQIAQIFHLAAVNNRPISSNHILLVSPPGMGKTSIAKSIAVGCNRRLEKISLNGVNDVSVMKGHSLAYISADSGRIIKSLRKAGTTKCLLLLDEIDKLGSREGSNASDAIVDLLDDSSEFTDNFLDLPLDLSDTLIIATANDLSKVNPVILDRFTVVTMEGYTEKEKNNIVKDYIIPKAISEMCPKDIDLSFSNSAIELIIKTYCKSLGVRDANKTVRRIIQTVLFENRKKKSKKIIIKDTNVTKILGTPPAERGNFPSETYSGLSKALAVTGDNCGMAFAIETMLIPNEADVTITGLPKESTIDSVKLAMSYIKCNYPDSFKEKGVHIHFGEGAVQKDGPSAGVAILLSMLSAVFDKPITENVSYTGEINGNGYVFNIGGVLAKIQAAQQSGCTKVFIPYGNYVELSKNQLNQFSVQVVPVKHISEVIKEVFPNLAA